MDRGGNGKWVQGQQKTHTSLERVGFMFKAYRFGTLFLAVAHEVFGPLNSLISLKFWWRFTDSNRGPVDYDEKVYENTHINQRYFSGV